MSWLRRLTRIVRANINARRCQTTDPAEALRTTLDTLRGTVETLRARQAQVRADLRKKEVALAAAREAVAELGRRTQQAASEGQEELARHYLQRLRVAEEKAATLQETVHRQRELAQEIAAAHQDLLARVTGIEQRSLALLNRASVVRNQRRLYALLEEAYALDPASILAGIEQRAEAMAREALEPLTLEEYGDMEWSGVTRPPSQVAPVQSTAPEGEIRSRALEFLPPDSPAAKGEKPAAES